MKKVIRRTFELLLATLAISIQILSASPPSTKPPPEKPAERFKYFTSIFTGTVERVRKDKYGYSSSGEVTVNEIFKNPSIPKKILIDGAGGPTNPARIFSEGVTYLFYLRDMGRADAYSDLVIPLKDAQNDLNFIRGKVGKSPSGK